MNRCECGAELDDSDLIACSAVCAEKYWAKMRRGLKSFQSVLNAREAVEGDVGFPVPKDTEPK